MLASGAVRRPAHAGDPAAACRRAATPHTGARRRAPALPARSDPVPAVARCCPDSGPSAYPRALCSTPARASADDRILARPVEPRGPGDAEVEIAVPNPADRAELVAALAVGSQHRGRRPVPRLLGRPPPYRDRLFAPRTTDPYAGAVRRDPAARSPTAGSTASALSTPPGMFPPARPPPGLSSRVPSLQPAPTPVKLPRQPGDAAGAAPGAGSPTIAATHPPSGLLGAVGRHRSGRGRPRSIRVPNRPDLLPAGGIYAPRTGRHTADPDGRPPFEPTMT